MIVMNPGGCVLLVSMLDKDRVFARNEDTVTLCASDVESSQDVFIICYDFKWFPRITVVVHLVGESWVLVPLLLGLSECMLCEGSKQRCKVFHIKL